MRTYHVHKAGAIDKEVDDVIIVIGGINGPIDQADRDNADIFMTSEAGMIVYALFRSLPQGTLNRVAALLLQRLAGVMMKPYEEVKA